MIVKIDKIEKNRMFELDNYAIFSVLFCRNLCSVHLVNEKNGLYTEYNREVLYGAESYLPGNFKSSP